MLEGQDLLLLWGFPVPPHQNIHHFLRQRFSVPANADLKLIGDALDRLSRLRNVADYQLASSGPFASAYRTQVALVDAQRAVATLDQMRVDPARRAAAIAAIQASFP